MMTTQELGQFMADKREQASCSQDDAAHLARPHVPVGYPRKMNAVAVHRIEKASSEPDLILVAALLKAYGVPADDVPVELRDRFAAIATLVGLTSSWRVALQELATVEESHAA